MRWTSRPGKPVGGGLLMVLALALFLTGSKGGADTPRPEARIGPRLRAVAARGGDLGSLTRSGSPLAAPRPRGLRGAPPDEAGGISPQGPVSLFLTGDPDPEQLRELGVRLRTRAGDVWTATAPLDAVPRLARVAGLERAALASPLATQLDLAVPAVAADTLRERSGEMWTGRTGAGVIVGILDSGLDVHHEDFLHPDGSTRVLFYWDQTDSTGTPPSIDPGGELYGTEWTADDIDQGRITATDQIGHGTHVAGIAAGDGSASQDDGRRYLFTGLAPNADLIVVDAVFLDATVLDAAAYVFARAEALGRPAVINLSVGGHFGPHDGTSPLEVGLDALVGPGKLAAVSAGNEAYDWIHAEVVVPGAGSDSATVTVPSYTADPVANFITVDAYYDEPGRLEVTVVTPAGQRFGPYALGAEQPDTTTGEGTLFLVHLDPDPVGSHLEVYVEISDLDPAPGFSLEAAPPPASGDWTLVFGNKDDAREVEIDLWIPLYRPWVPPLIPRWDEESYDPEEEVSIPGTARRVVTVGSFNSKRCWATSAGGEACTPLPDPLPEVGRVTFFSNHGPTRDDRQKPDVVAPGFVVSSSYSRQIAPEIQATIDPDRVDPDGEHLVMAGTSMSAPHVTGALALYLEEHPTAAPETVLVRMRAAAVQDEYTGETWDLQAGHGKLDVAAFLDPGLVPVRVRDFTLATSAGGLAVLSWRADPGEAVSRFLLCSRGTDTAWLDRASFTGAGPHRWEDPESGDDTRYRLLATRRTGETVVWAEAHWSARPRPPALVLAPAQPNPFTAGASITFRLEGEIDERALDVEIIDAAGRVVRRFGCPPIGAGGAGVITWDGADDGGRPVSAGVYWALARTGDLWASVKLVKVR